MKKKNKFSSTSSVGFPSPKGSPTNQEPGNLGIYLFMTKEHRENTKQVHENLLQAIAAQLMATDF